MAIIREQNWLGNQRVDLPHLRSLDSGVRNDIDLLAGSILAGEQALVVQGFDIITTAAVGNSATSLKMNVANSILVNKLATETGSIFVVPSDRAIETLSSTNNRVNGSFTAGTTNFIGIDLRRSADSTTEDLVQFIDPNTKLEKAKAVPLARTLDYIIIVTTQDFSTVPGITPVARIITDVNNVVTEVKDARNLFFRLGSGGSFIDTKNAYSWPGNRSESGLNDNFNDTDKVIHSFKEWMNAAMTRIWEIGGGNQWYSPTADRNVTLARGMQGDPAVFVSTFTNGEYFEWDGTNLHWKGLRFIFDNSGGTVNFNDIKNQTTNSAGLTNLADGECLYADLDRTQNLFGLTALQPAKAVLATLGMSTIPGARQVIAWRAGTQIFTRGVGWPVNSSFNPATGDSTLGPGALGVVRLDARPMEDGGWADNLTPEAILADVTRRAVATGLTRGLAGANTIIPAGTISIATGTNDTGLSFGQGNPFISAFTGRITAIANNAGAGTTTLNVLGYNNPAGAAAGGNAGLFTGGASLNNGGQGLTVVGGQTNAGGIAGSAVTATGGNDTTTGTAGKGIVAVGGNTVDGAPGVGITATGGNNTGLSGSSTGANGGVFQGGVSATDDGGFGIVATGGNSLVSSGGVGVKGYGGDGTSIFGQNDGVHGTAGSGLGGNTGGTGVIGFGQGIVTGYGVIGYGGGSAAIPAGTASPKTGVFGIGGTDGIGVKGVGKGTGVGIVAQALSSSNDSNIFEGQNSSAIAGLRLDHSGFPTGPISTFEQFWQYGFSDSGPTAPTAFTFYPWTYEIGGTGTGIVESPFALPYSLNAACLKVRPDSGSFTRVYTNTEIVKLYANTVITAEWEMTIDAGAGAPNITVGFTNTPTAANTPVNGDFNAFFRRSGITNWRGFVSDGGTGGFSSDFGVAPVAAGIQKFKLELHGSGGIYGAGGKARFWIDGVVHDVTASVPLAAAMYFVIAVDVGITATPRALAITPVTIRWNRY